MATSTIFLDANILLEIVLDRPQAATVRQLLERTDETCGISVLTAHLVVHFGQKVTELPVLRAFLADYDVLGLEASDFEWAFVNARSRDYKDALQLAVAIRHGYGQFVTFDDQLRKAYESLPTIHVLGLS